MKLVLLFALFVTGNAFAMDVCSFDQTPDFHDALDAYKIKPHKTSRNHKRFTFVEKQMIHLTVSLEEWLEGTSKEDALFRFGDYYEGKPSLDAGEITYFQLGSTEVALVHYWPGENEYGAFYEIRKGAFRLMAQIQDGFITCRK